jgi:hypothetical protein
MIIHSKNIPICIKSFSVLPSSRGTNFKIVPDGVFIDIEYIEFTRRDLEIIISTVEAFPKSKRGRKLL